MMAYSVEAWSFVRAYSRLVWGNITCMVLVSMLKMHIFPSSVDAIARPALSRMLVKLSPARSQVSE
jgi:hypothetical protein